MKLHRTFQFNPALCGIIPLVNVLFLVLVYYSMGSRFILQPGIQVSLPPTESVFEPQSNAHVVSLTAAPNPTLYYHDQRISLESLLQRLEENPSAARTLILKADQGAPLGNVQELINGAARRGYRVILAGEIPKP